MKPITLTAIRGGTYTNERDVAIRVNPAAIRFYASHKLIDGTEAAFVVLGDHDNDRFYVRETPELIDRKLHQLGYEGRTVEESLEILSGAVAEKVYGVQR